MDTLKVIVIILGVLATGLLFEGEKFLVFKRKYGEDPKWGKRWKRKFRTLKKCGQLLILPIPAAIGWGLIWDILFFKKDFHLSESLEGIATCVWIPTFGILYAIITAIIFSSLWDQYNEMRMAVKRYDLEKFMDLRDEELSPLVHTLMFALSGAILGGFLGLKYPDFISGVLCVSSTAYLLGLLFFVVVEVDDPCSGIWSIRSIPAEWLAINAKTWRQKRNKDSHEKFLKSMTAFEREMFDSHLDEVSGVDLAAVKSALRSKVSRSIVRADGWFVFRWRKRK